MHIETFNTVERREQIISLLNSEKTISVNKLSKIFNVSAVTIRNDLRHLEKQGCILRSYGGAMINKTFAFDRPLLDKSRINFTSKNKIAQKATELVEDGDHIILDSGSTTALMVPYLSQKKDLVVLTNALNIAYDLANNNNIEIIVTGGNVRKNTYSISGQTVEQILKMYHFNKLFLGVDGFDIKTGITTPNFAEACVNKTMCEVTDKIIAITDSSKFGRKSFCMIEKVKNIDYVVTDSGIPPNYLSELYTLGINVIIADV